MPDLIALRRRIIAEVRERATSQRSLAAGLACADINCQSGHAMVRLEIGVNLALRKADRLEALAAKWEEHGIPKNYNAILRQHES